MDPIAADVAKELRYKIETTFNTAPGTSGGQSLRNVESDLDIAKDTYQSNEKRSDYQISDYRHGIRKTAGTIKGELSPGTYADFFAASLRRNFAAVSASTGLAITIAEGSIVDDIQQYTITRGSGSWITDGVKAGDVGRLSAGTFNAANAAKNLYVVSLTATVLTVITLNASALVAEGPIASSTFTLTGKKTYVPTTGHTDKSFAFEHWYSDISQSELFTGCKINTIDVSLPPTGMATIDMAVMGAGGITPNTSVYYTAPTAATSTGITAAVNGVLFIGGQAVGICTGMSFKIDGGYSGDPVVGSQTMPAIFADKVNITGQFTAFFNSATFRDAFLNETELSLSVVLTADNTAASDFLAFTIPRIKLGDAKRSKSGKAIIVTSPFQALRNNAGGSGTTSEQTTLSVQDSAA